MIGHVGRDGNLDSVGGLGIIRCKVPGETGFGNNGISLLDVKVKKSGIYGRPGLSIAKVKTK